MTEVVFLVEDAPEGGLIARGLDAPIFTEADDLASLEANVRDAVTAHFDVADRPRVIRLHHVRDTLLAV